MKVHGKFVFKNKLTIDDVIELDKEKADEIVQEISKTMRIGMREGESFYIVFNGMVIRGSELIAAKVYIDEDEQDDEF